MTEFADVSTVVITQSVQEINKGNRLVAPSGGAVNTYLPHAPAGNISIRIISVYGGVSQAGQNTVHPEQGQMRWAGKGPYAWPCTARAKS